MKDTKKGSAEQSEMGLSLEDLIRRGARELIQKAIEVEVKELLEEYGTGDPTFRVEHAPDQEFHEGAAGAGWHPHQQNRTPLREQ